MSDNHFKPSLGSDNHSGIHPLLIESIQKVNKSHSPSYGTDTVTADGLESFKRSFGPMAQAFFVFNGTAANVLALKPLLKSYEAVICSEHSHLHKDECGAPEFQLGVKLLTLASRDGKITPAQIAGLLQRRGDQHHVQPRVVSITQPTELGVVYTMKEMQELRNFTRSENLLLHMDGARLANACHFLNASLKSVTEGIGIDALSLGGTKNGLMGCEAVVFWDETFARDFKFYRKQMMQLPSKMRFIAAQFQTYLDTGLWKEIAAHSHSMARRLEAGLRNIPEVEILFPVQSNAVFAVFPKTWTKPLKQDMFFYIWDERSWTARLMCSFDTQESDIDKFLDHISKLRGA